MIVVRTEPDLLIEDGYKRICIEKDGTATIHGVGQVVHPTSGQRCHPPQKRSEITTLRVEDLDLPYQEIAHREGYHPTFDREAARARIAREYGVGPEDMRDD